MTKETSFGQLLRQYRQRAVDDKPGEILTQEKFSEQLTLVVGVNYAPTMISYWENMHRHIDHNDRKTLLGIIEVLYKNHKISFLEEANLLLESGNYRDLDPSEIRKINSKWLEDVPAKANDIFKNPLSPSIFFDWTKEQLQWREADDHMRSSAAGMILWSLRVLTDRMTPRGFLWAFLSLALWIATAWLIVPFLQWPLPSIQPRWNAGIQYAAATIIIPFIIGLLTSPENRPYKVETKQHRMILWSLKMTGAFVGFNGMALCLFFPVLSWYYLARSPIPTWVGWLLTLIPLTFSYIAAHRIPADRYKMFGEIPQMHPADKLFLGVFSVAGVLFAGILFYGYPYFSNPAMGYALLLLLTGVALWEQQKKIRDYLSDFQLIAVTGGFLPALIILVFLFVSEGFDSIGWTNVDEVLLFLLILIYAISPVTLWVTLTVRTRPVLTLPGVLGLAGISIFLLVIFEIDLTWGRIFTFLIVVIWFMWGRSRFRHLIWVHASFPLMLLGLGVSLSALLREWVPVWVNLILTLMLASWSIVWAYRTRPKPEPTQLS